MVRSIGWGVLGTGSIAGQFAEGLTFVPGARLAAVGSRTVEAARAFARVHSAVRSYGSYEALVADPDVDVVYVATPNHLHTAHCLLAIGSGKAVVCEKPFALDAKGAREVIEAARRARVFCMEALWTRFLPVVRDVAALVEGGGIGELRLSTLQLSLPFAPEPAGRQFASDLGGGALLDLGVYAVSLAHLFHGTPVAIESHAWLGPTGVDDQAVAILRYASGAEAVLTTGLRGQGANDAVLVGTEGTVRIHAPLYCPERYSLTRVTPMKPGGRVARGRLARVRNHPWVRPVVEQLRDRLPIGSAARPRTVTRRPLGNGYSEEAAEVMRCLRAGAFESPTMPWAATVEVMEILDLIRARWRVDNP